MKKLFAMLLALVLCLSAFALAEEDPWTAFTPLMTPILFESAESAVADESTRGLTAASMLIDLSMAEIGDYSFTDTDAYLLVDDGSLVLICNMPSDDMKCFVILMGLAEKQAYVRTAELTAELCRDALAEEANVWYTVTPEQISNAADAILDALTGQ